MRSPNDGSAIVYLRISVRIIVIGEPDYIRTIIEEDVVMSLNSITSSPNHYPAVIHLRNPISI